MEAGGNQPKLIDKEKAGKAERKVTALVDCPLISQKETKIKSSQKILRHSKRKKEIR
jgi:hypothetical protein